MQGQTVMLWSLSDDSWIDQQSLKAEPTESL